MPDIPVPRIHLRIPAAAGGAVRTDPDQARAIQIVLYALAMTPWLREGLFLKGGLLMNALGSPRFTRDIDFSFSEEIGPEDAELNRLREILNSAMQRSAERLANPDIRTRVQTIREKPKPLPSSRAPFPSLEVTIGHASRQNPNQLRQLEDGLASRVIRLDLSFHEPIGSFQEVEISDDRSLLAYSLTDLVAEKYRALLQQPVRNRRRRQDVYDLHFLIRHYGPTLQQSRQDILDVFRRKCEARDISPDPDSMNDPEIRERAAHGWESMRDEVELLPDFDPCFEDVAAFYRTLPWT